MGNPSKVLLFGSLTEEDTFVAMNQIKLGEKKQPKLNLSSPIASYPSPAHKDDNKVSGTTKLLVSPTKKEQTHNSSDLHSNQIKSNGRINTSFSSKPLNNGIKSNGTIRNSSSSEALNNNGNKSKAPLNNGEKYSNGTISSSSSSGSLNKEYHSKRNMPISVVQDITPRGLINTGNLCFLNATLQALLACSPFVDLLKGLRLLNLPKDVYPTLSAFAEFLGKFHVQEFIEINKKDAKALKNQVPFRPTIFGGVLRKFTPDVPSPILGMPRQEDAQKFLNFIMLEMHDEFLKLKGQEGQSHLDADVEWETVGKKNKSAGMRTETFVPSELSSVFGGQLRSVVKTKDNKPSSAATIQPFMLLHLDVSHEGVRTIWDALHLFSAPESFKGEVMTESKIIKFFSLPKILILHLSQENTKLRKAVSFPLELQLTHDLLHVSSVSKGRRYKLVATLTYRGEASKGHHIADVRQANGEWLRFDNSAVTAISTYRVLKEQAYVLFYEQL